MTLVEIIRNDVLTARKNRNMTALAYLTTLLSAADMIGKNDGNRATTDKEVLSTVSKTLDAVLFTLPLTADADKKAALEAEKDYLMAFVESHAPKKVSAEVVAPVVTELVAALPEKSMKAMGGVMSKLKERFGDSLDTAEASVMVRKALA